MGWKCLGWTDDETPDRCKGPESDESGMSRHPRAVSDYMAAIGAKGGKTKGKRKARSPEHYERLAAMKRKKK